MARDAWHNVYDPPAPAITRATIVAAVTQGAWWHIGNLAMQTCTTLDSMKAVQEMDRHEAHSNEVEPTTELTAAESAMAEPTAVSPTEGEATTAPEKPI